MSKLTYLSQPSRLGGSGKESYRQSVIDALTDKGLHLVHPFEALPYLRFEGHPSVGRSLAMQYCCDLIDACRGGIAMTGISEGTLLEAAYLLEKYPYRRLVLYPKFDPSWEQEIEKFRKLAGFKTIADKITSLKQKNDAAFRRLIYFEL